MIKQIDFIYKIFKRSLRPHHYKEFEKYFKIKNKDNKFSENTIFIENFRNSLHYNDKRFFHLKDGFFSLSEWFDIKQKRLFNLEPKEIEFNRKIVSKATKEVGERFPYIYNKYDDTILEHLNKYIKGKLPEEHIKNFFQENYFDEYEKPHNDYKTPDTYDFKLVFKNKELKFDIKTIGVYNKEDALWLEKNRINECDFYICQKTNGNIKIWGFVSKDEINKSYVVNSTKHSKSFYVFSWKNWHDIYYLIIYLNHLKLGYDYKEILKNGYLFKT